MKMFLIFHNCSWSIVIRPLINDISKILVCRVTYLLFASVLLKCGMHYHHVNLQILELITRGEQLINM